METAVPRKIATSSRETKAAASVVTITAASEPVALRQMRMLRRLISVMATQITRAAKQALGMYSTNGPNKMAPIKQNTPLMTLLRRVTAPEAKFNAERVNEPEAGMPLRNAPAIFTTPRLSMS